LSILLLDFFKHFKHDVVDFLLEQESFGLLLFPEAFELCYIVCVGGRDSELSVFEEVDRLQFLIDIFLLLLNVLIKVWNPFEDLVEEAEELLVVEH
jgi:hypothetical protein